MEHVGTYLRKWRKVRNLSQMQLANTAEVSARHISFIETGRSRPGREVLLVLASQLEIPLRERNVLLQAAGYRPAYRQTALDAPEMEPVRGALDLILTHHEPYPAVVLDRAANILKTNEAGTTLVQWACSDSEAVLKDGPPNLYRVLTHPAGIRDRVRNWEEVVGHILHRADHEVTADRNEELAGVLEQVRTYPEIPPPDFAPGTSPSLLLPIEIEIRGETIGLLSTIASLGTAIDITLLDLRVETWFPADSHSARRWERLYES